MEKEFLAFHKESLAEVTKVAGEEFTYNGCVYPGIINVQELSTDLVEGGLLEVFSTHIVVSKELLHVAPVAGQTLFIGTQKGRIIRVGSDEVSWEMDVVTAAK